MHELSILMSMANELKSLPEIKQGGALKKVVITIGEVSGVDENALEFAYPLLKEQDPFFENAELEISLVSLQVTCNDCGTLSKAMINDVKCCECNSRNIKFSGGDEILISEIEFDS